ncbi:MAG: HDIG domain-containing protein [Actinomycetota bacterium]|nr:HDIG domain-containing protein [Actinomycetota bacterium]
MSPVLSRVAKRLKENRAIGDDRFQKIILASFISFLLILILSLDITPQIKDIREGSPSPRTIKASRAIEFIDDEKTEAKKESVASAVEEVFKRDVTAKDRAVTKLDDFFKAVSAVKKGNDRSNCLIILKEEYGAAISDQSLLILLELNNSEFATFTEKTKSLLTSIMAGNILEEDISDKKEELRGLSTMLSLPRVQIEAAAEIGAAFIEPNYYYDKDATEILKAEVVAEVEPYLVKKMQGEVIVREGELVSNDHLKVLSELGLLKEKLDVRRLVGETLFILSLILIFAVYAHKFERDLYDNNPLLLLFGLLLLIVSFIAKTIAPYFSSYLVPIAAASMVATIILGSNMGILMVMISTLVTTHIVGGNLQYFTVAILGGVFAVYLVSDISHRHDLTKAGLILSPSMFFICFTSDLTLGAPIMDALKNAAWGFASGVSSAVITIGALPFLESGFGLTTDVKLLDLANTTQPLLKELMTKAPGTYNHSVMVGNLAEAAAEEIGANPLLARVGSYYHDIGKLKRPFFFVENQASCDNPHDKTNPNLSYLIINAHVKDGVELAKKNRLGYEIVKIIEQHHGTGLITYFYHRAKEINEKHEVKEVQFRYTGEKPTTKEAAIIMLADSVEAAARTITKLSPARLEQLVRKVIHGKLDDGQMDESNLTLSDLEGISKSFANTLASIYHSRIEYPNLELISQSKGLSKFGNSTNR